MSRFGVGAGFFLSRLVIGLVDLVLLALVIVVVVWLVRRFVGGRRALLNHLDPAQRLLRRRYAAGEIGREEFLGRMADLRGEFAPPPEPPPRTGPAPQAGPPPQPPTRN